MLLDALGFIAIIVAGLTIAGIVWTILYVLIGMGAVFAQIGWSMLMDRFELKRRRW